ncbi:uncharacterized protein LOC141906149 isoform X2 [Tubulanus polymorphus]|uniref:uncharacterized protein LOC141906149 isoform X2 n=1 Tax=Tubulanus polymorphus TaxID=672921 RepID=UPI003DA6CD8D
MQDMKQSDAIKRNISLDKIISLDDRTCTGYCSSTNRRWYEERVCDTYCCWKNYHKYCCVEIENRIHIVDNQVSTGHQRQSCGLNEIGWRTRIFGLLPGLLVLIVVTVIVIVLIAYFSYKFHRAGVSRDDNVARQDVSRVRPLSFYRQATDLRWTSVEFIEEIETRPEPSAPKENLQNNEPIKGQIIDKDVYDQQPIITDVLTPVSDDNRRFVHESIENLYQNETSNVDRNQCFLYERYPSQYQQFAYYYESD